MHEGKHGIIDEWDFRPELFAEEDDGAGATSLKKGCIVMKKNNFLKVTYSHRNSEMEGVGAKVVDWIRSAGAAAISDYFDRVKVIREEDPMTPEQVESYANRFGERISTAGCELRRSLVVDLQGKRQRVHEHADGV